MLISIKGVIKMTKRRVLLYTVMLLATVLMLLAFTGCVDTTEYKVTLVGDEHVRLRTEKPTYRKGETVTVIKDLDPGYSCYTMYGSITFFDTFEMDACDVTVTATSYLRTYRITYVGYGDDYSNHYGKLTSEYTIEDEFRLPTPVKNGYRFLGWYSDEALTVPVDNTVKKGTTGDLTLYPKFEIASYTVTYHLPTGAVNNPDNVESYTIDDGAEYIELLPPSMDNCQFLGWYQSEEFGGNEIKRFSPNIARDLDLYPKFLSLDYTEDGYRIIRNRTDLEEIFKGDYDKTGKYRLLGDINFRPGEDTPTISGFEGVFDGGGYKITNLNGALFDTLSGATVKDLSISASISVTLKVESEVARNIGALANEAIGSGTVTIKNVHVLGFEVSTHLIAPLNLGGMIGNARTSGDLIIDGCTVTGLNYNVFIARTAYVGGMIGQGKANITNSEVTHLEDHDFNIECTGDGSVLYVGGFAGFLHGTITDSIFTQENSGAQINVYASLYCNIAAIGGLVGGANDLTVENSHATMHEINFDSNAKSTTSLKIYIAGLVGRNTGGLMLRKCYIQTGALGLNFNSTIKKDGYPALRFRVGFLACEITEDNLEECSVSDRVILNDGEIIDSQYIDDDHLVLN